MKKVISSAMFLICFAGIFQPRAIGAVGCTLNDPDRDIRRLFPASTGYRTEFISIQEKGGGELGREIEDKLGDRFEPVYETLDVPYAYYTVLSGRETVGYVHGVNQKGRFGGMQIILATDTDGRIIDFYYQKLSSPEARRFRDRSFTSKFRGMSLKDFYEGLSEKDISDPSEKNQEDFHNTLRGMKKNLILLDEFKLDNRNDKYYEKSRE